MPIVKLLARHNPTFNSLIRYILDEGKTNPSQVITHNLRSNTIEGYVKEFAENEAFRRQSRSDQVFLYHEILSFHCNEDASVFTPEVINDITKEYIRLRGMEGVYVAAPHFDRTHVHIHLAVSALKYRTGVSNGLFKAKLRELKLSIQQYHRDKYPNIAHSFPEHGKGKAYVTDRAWQTIHRKEREEYKQQIMDTVRKCFDGARSQTHFLELLRDKDLHHYKRNGKAAGIEYEGAKFRFSRLLEKGLFENLPVDVSDEEKVLADIRAIREQRAKTEHDRDREGGAR